MARTSVDADIVAALTLTHVAPLIDRLHLDYYVPAERLRWAVTARSSCNLIHLATMFKIDLFVPKDRPFDQAAARRTRLDAIDDAPDAPVVPIASAEDTVLAKLEWTGQKESSRGADGTPPPPGEGPARPVRQRSNLLWAQLMARSFGRITNCTRHSGSG